MLLRSSLGKEQDKPQFGAREDCAGVRDVQMWTSAKNGMNSRGDGDLLYLRDWLGDGQTVFAKPLNVKFNSFADQLFGLFDGRGSDTESR